MYDHRAVIQAKFKNYTSDDLIKFYKESMGSDRDDAAFEIERRKGDECNV